MSTTASPVYVIDDDVSVRESIESLVRSAGLPVHTFGSAREFLAAPRADAPSCLVLDLRLPGVGGLELQRTLARADDPIPIIFLTGHGDIPTSVRAIKAGALAFLTKPFDDNDLLRAIRDAIAHDHRVRMDPQTSHIIGSSTVWRRVMAHATRVAATDATVLLTGESGTGKELVARHIHQESRRAPGPFVALNCAALPETLLESELFGHERGAFTGAVASHAGRIEQAAGGTLFLDEIAEMAPAVQAKFLRVIEQREFQRLGGTRTFAADIRIVAATNRDLTAAMQAGQFREDLYYRLHVFPIDLPPLRSRPDDIPALVDHFVRELAPMLTGRPSGGVSPEAHAMLAAYRWPGNVRQLRNAVQQALILSGGRMIDREHLPALAESPSSAPALLDEREFPSEGIDLAATERALVEAALQRAGQNKSKAARLLGLPRGRLYTLLQRFDLS